MGVLHTPKLLSSSVIAALENARLIADVIVRGDADWSAIVPMLRAYAEAKGSELSTAAAL